MKTIATVALVVSLSGSLFAKAPVPRTAADFQVLDPSGKTRKLSDYRGKVVLVQFLYTTCAHCQDTARMLSGLQNELSPRGLQVIGVAFEPGVQNEAIERFKATTGANFPIGSALSETVLGYLGISVMVRYVVPQILIVDRNGTIRAQSEPTGSPELQNESHLRTLLGRLLGEKSTVRQTHRQ